MKPLFEPKLRKVMSKILNKEYWISDREMSPQDGLPVYSQREIDLIKRRNYSKEYLELIYITKLTTFATLFEIEALEAKKTLDYGKSKLTQVEMDIIADIKNILK